MYTVKKPALKHLVLFLVSPLYLNRQPILCFLVMLVHFMLLAQILCLYLDGAGDEGDCGDALFGSPL